MKSGEGFCQALIISGQPAEAGSPGKTALDHPAAWQQDEAAFGLGMFDDLQLDAMLFGGRGGVFSRVSLIGKSQFDMFTSYLLHLSRQLAHLSAVLFIGRSHVQSQQMTQRVHHRMHLRSLASLGSIVTGACPR